MAKSRTTSAPWHLTGTLRSVGVICQIWRPRVGGLMYPNTYTCSMFSVPCVPAVFVEMSTAVWAVHLSLLVSLDRGERTVHVVNAAYGSERQVRLVLCYCYHRFLQGCLSYSPSCVLICTPALCWFVFLNVCQNSAFTGWNWSPSLLSRTCCSLMTRGMQLLLTVNISMQELPLQSIVFCFVLCVSVITRGAEYGRTA